jgi:hypothetical protein
MVTETLIYDTLGHVGCRVKFMHNSSFASAILGGRLVSMGQSHKSIPATIRNFSIPEAFDSASTP